MILFSKHPESVCMTYCSHFQLSTRLSFLFAKASIQALIHAFLPFWYASASTRNAHQIVQLIEASGCHSPPPAAASDPKGDR